jgi:orotidine-5'-phosphate decarboxylase
MTTVHAHDKDILKAAVNGSKGKVKILGITALTSSKSHTSIIMDNTFNVFTAGGYGVVCPGAYINAIKKQYPGLTVVVPGVRPYKSFINWIREKRTNDHWYRITPSKAIKYGQTI